MVSCMVAWSSSRPWKYHKIKSSFESMFLPPFMSHWIPCPFTSKIMYYSPQPDYLIMFGAIPSISRSSWVDIFINTIAFTEFMAFRNFSFPWDNPISSHQLISNYLSATVCGTWSMRISSSSLDKQFPVWNRASSNLPQTPALTCLFDSRSLLHRESSKCQGFANEAFHAWWLDDLGIT